MFIVIDNFSKLGWTTPLKNKSSPEIKDSFKIVLIDSQRSPNLIETDRGKRVSNKNLTVFFE